MNDWVLQPSAQPDSFYTRFSIWDMNWDAPRGYTLTGHPLDSFHSRQDGAYAMARWNLTDRLKPTGCTITRLAQGVPIGGALDVLDDGTLAAAFKARRPL